MYAWRRNHAFMSNDAIAMADRSATGPWLQPPDGTLPGKAAHIAWILGILPFLEDWHPNKIERIAPLMSQPVVELCLRIPSWFWCEGGRNRATARRAFSDDLPAAVLARRTKSTPGSFVIEILETNKAKIRDMLLGGLLAEAGMLDIDAVAACLQRDVMPPLTVWRILALVDVEAWLRSNEPRMRVSAA